MPKSPSITNAKLLMFFGDDSKTRWSRRCLPWSFKSLEEAGEFCRHLFGMTKLTADEAADAMGREIGFDMSKGRPHLGRVLRRIVADAR
jgi:hypothetical protein